MPYAAANVIEGRRRDCAQQPEESAVHGTLPLTLLCINVVPMYCLARQSL